MNQTRFVLFFCFLNFISTAQNNSELRKTLGLPSSDCEETSIQSQSEIVALDFSELEKIEKIAKVWSDVCGYNEAVFRIEILLSIATDTLKEADLDSLSYSYFLENFENRSRESKYYDADSIFHYDREYYLHIPLNSEFDKWTALWAETLLEQPTSGFEHLFLSIYTAKNPDHWEDNLYSKKYDDVEIIRNQREVDQKEAYEDSYTQFLLGTWIPTGSMSEFLATSPSFGFNIGSPIFSDHWRVQFGMMFHIPNNLQRFRISTEDSTVLTKANFIYNLHIGAVRELVENKNYHFRLIGDLGLDFLNTDTDKPEFEDSEEDAGVFSITTYNIGFGLDFGLRTKKNNYWGLRAMYNILDYNIGLRAADSLGGNPFSLLLYYQF